MSKKELPEGMVNDLTDIRAKDVKAGMRVGRWVVIEDGYTRENNTTKIKVRCTCGSEIEKNLAMGDLKNNTSLSCGCYFKENSSKTHKGKTISKEQREQHSQRMTGEGNPMYGKCHSEETKRKIGDKTKERVGEKHWNYGKHESEETKRKQSEARKGRFCGENSPFWNPNLTDEERIRQRTGTGNYQWKQQVKELANYTCDCCGKRGVKLNSHHLDNYKNNPNKRIDVSNGVCLCEQCHKEFHSYMGGYKVKCTADDYYKWKQLKQEELNSENSDSNVA